MSGALGVLVAGPTPTIVAVTIGADANNTGYSSSVGSISPNSYLGKEIDDIRSPATATAYDLIILIPAHILGQSAFNHILIEDGTGAIRRYTSASATYRVIASVESEWRWGDGSNRVWLPADAGEVRRVIFYP